MTKKEITSEITDFGHVYTYIHGQTYNMWPNMFSYYTLSMQYCAQDSGVEAPEGKYKEVHNTVCGTYVVYHQINFLPLEFSSASHLHQGAASS